MGGRQRLDLIRCRRTAMTTARPILMFQVLPNAVVDHLSAACSAVVRLFGRENAVEIATAAFGLGCIVIGSAVFLLER